MIIRPTKDVIGPLVLMYVLIFIFCTVLIAIERNIVAVIVSLCFVLATIPRVVSSCRTIIMTKDGCTICFGKYKRHYSWEELDFKQYVKYTGVFTRATNSTCSRAAEFCPKKVKIPRRWDAHAFSMFCHPFIFFFVLFPDSPSQNRSKKFCWSGVPYMVNEEVFRNKLKEWGVEMEETVRGIYAE